MFYLDKRLFLKNILAVSGILSLNVVFYDNFLKDHANKFVCEEFYLMGTHGKIQIFCDNIEYGKFLIKKAINKINEIDMLLTKFSPLSDIGKINSNLNEFTSVSIDTFNILNFGKYVSDMTLGYFDMGLGNILSYSGIDAFVPMVGTLTKSKDMQTDLFVSYDNKVKLIRKNSMIDLGGIGKGFALDECMNILIKGGIHHSAIEFGGDVKVFGGMPNNLPWKIILDKRLHTILNDKVLFFNIFNGSLAVSGSYIKKSLCNDYHHIINPYSLKSQNYYIFLLVSGNDGILCDALSTACFNMDIDTINSVISKFPGYQVKTFF